MSRNVVALLDNAEGREMIKAECKNEGILFQEFAELVELEVKQVGKKRRSALWDSFDDILDRIVED